jgi:predicted RNase H-like HicB family nuclease
MQRTIQAFITRGESVFVGECHGINVVTQGKSIDETVENLRTAVGLFLEGEDPAEFGLLPNPILLVSLEVEPLAHAG